MADDNKSSFNLSHSSPQSSSGGSQQTATVRPSFPNEEYLHNDVSCDQALGKIRTAGSIQISPGLFEKIYLSKQNVVKGDLRKTFGNPTPLAILGFLMGITPLSCDLMGWRGAGGNGASDTAVYFFMGGLMTFLGGLLEFFLGNTFPFVVFCSFGGFQLSYGGTLLPSFNAYGAYSPDPSNPALGLKSPSFSASFAFFMLFMGLLCLIYLICSLQTNIVFVIIFFSLVPGFGFMAGSYWNLALGNEALASKLQVAAGACTFVTSMAGWWIFFAQMLACVDFPLQLPVGDISHAFKVQSARRQKEDV